MAVITDQQRKFYETTLQVTKQEISDLKDQIEEELAKVKDRIAELQNAINASKQMYAAAGARLGGADDFSDEPAQAKSLPRVGGVQPDVEKIVALKPDLVIANAAGLH